MPCLAHLAEVAFDEQPARDIAAEPLRLHPGPILVVASPDEIVPFLAETERRAVWTRTLDEASLAVADVDALAARYKIGPDARGDQRKPPWPALRSSSTKLRRRVATLNYFPPLLT